MIRNIDLLQKLLLYIQENKPAGESLFDPKILGYDPATIGEHIEQLKDDEFIEAKIDKDCNMYIHISIERITSKGYDFLELSKDKSILNSAKDKIIKKGIPMTLNFVFEYLKQEAKTRLGLP